MTKPLSTIDESLRTAGNFLKKLKDDPRKLNSLEIFVESKIMKWIKHEVPKG